MTDEEALKLAAGVHKNSKHPDTKALMEVAISALRERIERRNPQPLTLEKLREMDGEPVWLKDGIGEGWFLTGAVYGSKIYFCEKAITVGKPLSECGKSWLVYRSKPEQEGSHGR